MFTEEQKQDLIKSLTEMLSTDKGFADVIRKIHVAEKTTEDFSGLSKEEKTAKFFKALVEGRKDLAHSISGSTDEILVPSEFRADVIKRIEEQPLALRNYVHVVPTTKRSGTIPTIDGGVVMKWADNDSKTASDKETKPTFGSVEYTVHRLEGYTALQKDTVNDSPLHLYNILLNLYADALIAAENQAILRGDGSQKPKGFMTDLELKEITSETFDEIISMPYQLPASKRAGAVYIASTQAIINMRLMKDKTGKYLWSDGNLSQGQLPTFNGYKVLELDECKESEKEPVVMGNLKDYYLVDRGELSTEINTQSDTAFFGNASIVKLQTRLDGLVVNNKSFVGYYFSNSAVMGLRKSKK